jgi:carbohydrate kinase (thermoresistant glucokinase family)
MEEICDNVGLRNRVLLLCGPAGCGKTTLGRLAAQATGAQFLDADDLHSPEAITKMRTGHGLSEADRTPWLQRVAQRMQQVPSRGMVIACSALRQRHREILTGGRQDVLTVYLKVPRATLAQRLGARKNHFAGVELLGSQLAALEEPGDVALDATGPLADVCARLLDRIGKWPLKTPTT